MRRGTLVVLFALSLIGLGVVLADDFNSDAEDIAAFETRVSLTVPQQVLGPNIYISGDGTLLLTQPPNNNTSTKLIVRDSVSLQSQADPTKYVTFEGPTATTSPFLLEGYVKLFIDQDQLGTDRMTAALLDCPAALPNASTGCTVIGPVSVAAVAPGGGSGFKERTVDFGFVSYTIPVGDELRLKIVNRAQQPVGTPVSSQDWRVSFGFNPARPSLLTVSPTP